MSIDQGPTLDIAAIVNGGEEFMTRMKAFKEAKETAEKSLADLKLGQSAQGALDEASRLRDEAKNHREAELNRTLADTTEIKRKTEEWVNATRAEATQVHLDAKARLDDANQKHAQATAVHADASARLADAQKQAESIIAEANQQAAQLAADAQQKADEMTKAAIAANAEAKAKLADAHTAKSKYETALAGIHEAVKAVG